MHDMNDVHARIVALFLVLLSGLSSALAGTMEAQQLDAPVQAKKLFVVLNQDSGWFQQNPKALHQIEQMVLDGVPGSIVETPKTKTDFAAAAQKLEALEDPQNYLVVVGGGDGTIGGFLTNMYHRNKRLPWKIGGFLALKAGSNNTLLKNYRAQNLYTNPVTVVKNLVSAMKGPRLSTEANEDGSQHRSGSDQYVLAAKSARPIDVNGELGFYFGGGVPAKLLKNLGDGKIHIGKAFTQLMGQLLTNDKVLAPVRGKIKVGDINDETHRDIRYMVAADPEVGNIHPLLRLFRGGKKGQMFFKASSMGTAETILKVLEIATGVTMTRNPKKLVARSADKASIEFAEETPYSLDGKLLTGKRVNLSSMPPLRIVYPQKVGGSGPKPFWRRLRHGR